jgi:hypothetical protein
MRLRLFMNIGLAYLLTAIVSTNSLGQSYGIQNDSSWSVIMEKDGVKFSVQRVYCETIPGKLPLFYSMLKIENLQDTPKNLSFNFGLAYKEGCSGCSDASEHHIDMMIGKKETIQGDCAFEKHQLTRLIVNPNLPKGWEFIGEQISNLSVH